MSICYGKTFKFLQKLPNASIIHAIFNKILHPFSFAACVKLFPKSHTKPSRGYFSEIFRLCQKNITKCKICFHGYSQISPGAKGFYFRYFPHFQLSYQLISDSLRFFCRIFLYFLDNFWFSHCFQLYQQSYQQLSRYFKQERWYSPWYEEPTNASSKSTTPKTLTLSALCCIWRTARQTPAKKHWNRRRSIF